MRNTKQTGTTEMALMKSGAARVRDASYQKLANNCLLSRLGGHNASCSAHVSDNVIQSLINCGLHRRWDLAIPRGCQLHVRPPAGFVINSTAEITVRFTRLANSVT